MNVKKIHIQMPMSLCHLPTEVQPRLWEKKSDPGQVDALSSQLVTMWISSLLGSPHSHTEKAGAVPH